MIDRDADRRRHLAMLMQTNPEVAALVEAAETAIRQWRGFSDSRRVRQGHGTKTLAQADDAEARVYREAAAALAPWRQAKEGAK